jgi:hypothetical protein
MKTLLLFLILPVADQPDYWRGRAVANTVAVVESAAPQPNPPNPTPTPGRCEECNGTGKLKPDGRIEINCWHCGGDGIVGEPQQATQRDTAQLESLLAENNVKIQELLQRLEQLDAKSQSLADRIDNLQVGKLLTQIKDKNDQLESTPSQGPSARNASASIAWLTDLDAALNEGRRTGRLVYAHFVTTPCPECVEWKRRVLSRPEVNQYITTTFVPVEVMIRSESDPLFRRYNEEERRIYSSADARMRRLLWGAFLAFPCEKIIDPKTNRTWTIPQRCYDGGTIRACGPADYLVTLKQFVTGKK